MIVKKLTWQERVKQIELFHQSHLKENEKWRLQDTARELNRSLGAISQDLLLASWLPNLPNKIATSKEVKVALEYINQRRREKRLGL